MSEVESIKAKIYDNLVIIEEAQLRNRQLNQQLAESKNDSKKPVKQQ